MTIVPGDRDRVPALFGDNATIRRVRAKSARPGSKKRRTVVKAPVEQPTFPMHDPISVAEAVPSAGYGSPEAIEAACDAHVIWSRSSPFTRVAIEGLMDGQSLVDIASDMKADRFKVARAIKALRVIKAPKFQLADAALISIKCPLRIPMGDAVNTPRQGPKIGPIGPTHLADELAAKVPCKEQALLAAGISSEN